MLLLNVAQEPAQRSFATGLSILCLLKVCAVLVHSIIREVHAPVVHGLGRGRSILRCAKPHEAIAEEEHAQVKAASLRRFATHEEIEPQVKLEAINEHWPRNVPLHHSGLVLVAAFCCTFAQPVQVHGQKDALALAEVVWFGNINDLGLRAVPKLLLQIPEIVGQDPCGRQELVLLWEDPLHSRHVPREPGLPRKRVVHPGEVIHPHPWLHTPEPIPDRRVVNPMHVALCAALLRLHDLPATGLRSCSHHFVVAVGGVK
mmetsp:Transcript_107783/g.300434  ORF Transcript_107783/g.300434 Transcript_107783/m.300434 type:complete len:259 (-) Transcript_107783:622-1398(-)